MKILVTLNSAGQVTSDNLTELQNIIRANKTDSDLSIGKITSLVLDIAKKALKSNHVFEADFGKGKDTVVFVNPEKLSVPLSVIKTKAGIRGNPGGEKEIHDALWRHFDPPKNVVRLINQSTMDLYYGPYAEGEDLDGYRYPGFVSAVKTIQKWTDKHLSEVWYDQNSDDVLESEPQGYEEEGEWIEPFWDDYYHLELHDVKKTMFGELASYV